MALSHRMTLTEKQIASNTLIERLHWIVNKLQLCSFQRDFNGTQTFSYLIDKIFRKSLENVDKHT